MKNPLFKKAKSFATPVGSKTIKIGTGEMSSSDVTRENYPIHFAIADALGGTVESFDIYQGPYIETKDGGRLFINTYDDGFSTVFNDVTTSESRKFYSNDPEGAIRAALSVTPKPTSNALGQIKKIRRDLLVAKKNKDKKTYTKLYDEAKNLIMNNEDVREWAKKFMLDLPSPHSLRTSESELKRRRRQVIEDAAADYSGTPREYKKRKTPSFSEEDRIRLHGLGVKSSLTRKWGIAIRAGLLQFDSNHYSFSKDASTSIRTELKDVVVAVNSQLNRRHIPKSAAAHEAAVKAIAASVHKENLRLEKIGNLAKRAASATHVLYDAGPTSYTVRVMKGNNTIDEYNAGNSAFDSVSQFNRTDKDVIKYERLLEFAEQTAKEMAHEFGVPENKVYHDEDLLDEEREEAWGLNDDDEKFLEEIGKVQDEVDPESGISLRDALSEQDKRERTPSKFDSKFLKNLGIKESSKKLKCPHCGSSEYGLMPTDFETAKCDKCGKNWEIGIVDGINNPKTAFFSPEDAERFRKENDGSDIILNEDGQEGLENNDEKKWEPVFDKEAKVKTANIYKVENGGNDHGWYIVGLPQEVYSLDGLETQPNSFIIPGLNHSLRTPEGLTLGIYEQLYDEYQTNDHLKEGDIFDTPVGKFICEGVHVLPYDDRAKAALKAAEQKKKEEEF